MFSTPQLSLAGACQEDIAASTSVRHAGLSQARRLADARPQLTYLNQLISTQFSGSSMSLCSATLTHDLLQVPQT